MTYILFSFNKKTRTVESIENMATRYDARITGAARAKVLDQSQYIYAHALKQWSRYSRKKPYDRGVMSLWKAVGESHVPPELKMYLLLGAAN